MSRYRNADDGFYDQQVMSRELEKQQQSEEDYYGKLSI